MLGAMREIQAGDVTNTIARLFDHSCYYLPPDVIIALKQAKEKERSPVCRDVLDKLLKNVEIADKEQIPICEDTGAAIVMLELGQEVQISGGDLYTAINEGVRQGYDKGYLRKSSENCSRLTVMTPAQGRQGVIDFVVDLVDAVGSNACPPVIIGVGIGGTTDKAMFIAKKALLRKVGEPSPDLDTADLEREILKKVNNLGIGAMGYGGTVTALAVHVETFPCHITSLPVAVNMQCWCDRREEVIL
jgi:fumarate hydratase subunit alpha